MDRFRRYYRLHQILFSRRLLVSAMKEVANRPRDVDDIQHLRWLLEEKRGNEPDT